MYSQFNNIFNKEVSAKALYTSLFLKNHSIMMLIEPESSKIIDANVSACKFYQYSKEEILNLCISDINTLSRDQAQKKLKKAFQEEENHFLFKHKLKDGTIKDVEVFSSPIEIYDQKFLFSIVNDLSKKIELKKKQEKAFSDLQIAQEKIHKLQEIIPVCSYCKKIRNDQGAWDTLEQFIEKESDTFVSHGICPECYEREMELIKKNNF